MAPVKPSRFEFDPGSIVQVRKHLGLSQAKLAARLGIPANTLWRWETGATTPDAHSLAAIYSVAVHHGVSTQFFQRREQMDKRLIVLWDLQTLPSAGTSVGKADAALREELEARFPTVLDRSFKVFAYPSDSQATDVLQELGWRVWEDDNDLSDTIISHSKSDCRHEPENTILVLMTHPGRDEFVAPVRELQSKGVEVHLASSGTMEMTALVNAVGEKNWIDWLYLDFDLRRRRMAKATKDRTRLLVFWDAQNLFDARFFVPKHLSVALASVRKRLDRLFPATSSRRFKAFVQQENPSFPKPTEELQWFGWLAEECDDVVDSIITQSKSDCEQEPENTILVLMTSLSSGKYAALVRELKRKLVDVHLMSPESMWLPWCKEEPVLVEAVGQERWIKLTRPGWSGIVSGGNA